MPKIKDVTEATTLNDSDSFPLGRVGGTTALRATWAKFKELLFPPVSSSILISQPNGTHIAVATLEEARTSSLAVGRTVTVTSVLTETQSNITAPWPSDRALKVEKGGSINPTTKWVYDKGTVKEIHPEDFGAYNDGTHPTETVLGWRRALAAAVGGDGTYGPPTDYRVSVIGAGSSANYAFNATVLIPSNNVSPLVIDLKHSTVTCSNGISSAFEVNAAAWPNTVHHLTIQNIVFTGTVSDSFLYIHGGNFYENYIKNIVAWGGNAIAPSIVHFHNDSASNQPGVVTIDNIKGGDRITNVLHFTKGVGGLNLYDDFTINNISATDTAPNSAGTGLAILGDTGTYLSNSKVSNIYGPIKWSGGDTFVLNTDFDNLYVESARAAGVHLDISPAANVKISRVRTLLGDTATQTWSSINIQNGSGAVLDRVQLAGNAGVFPYLTSAYPAIVIGAGASKIDVTNFNPAGVRYGISIDVSATDVRINTDKNIVGVTNLADVTTATTTPLMTIPLSRALNSYTFAITGEVEGAGSKSWVIRCVGKLTDGTTVFTNDVTSFTTSVAVGSLLIEGKISQFSSHTLFPSVRTYLGSTLVSNTFFGMPSQGYQGYADKIEVSVVSTLVTSGTIHITGVYSQRIDNTQVNYGL